MSRKARHYVLSLGLGVQSTAVYLLAMEGKFPLDAAIFADTGEEPSWVYRHLEHLQSLGGPPIYVDSLGRLGDDLVHGRGGKFIPSIPYFLKGTEKLIAPGCTNSVPPKPTVGIERRLCTTHYKVLVVKKSIRERVLHLPKGRRQPKSVKVYQYIGISTDERSRADPIRERNSRYLESTFPLLDIGWSREDCSRYVSTKLPYEVRKSSCVFCPYKTNKEWKYLKDNDPEGWVRAVEIDNALRNGAEVVGNLITTPHLHRSCIPLELIDFDKEKTLFRPMKDECQGMCGN